MIWVFGLVILGFASGQVGVASTSCGFQAVYNFGDSNSDTGARSAALGAVPPPNGITFFGKPSGRACDGRLIIDFIGKQESLHVYQPLMVFQFIYCSRILANSLVFRKKKKEKIKHTYSLMQLKIWDCHT